MKNFNEFITQLAEANPGTINNPADLEIWNKSVLLNPICFADYLKDNNLFQAANLKAWAGKRPADNTEIPPKLYTQPILFGQYLQHFFNMTASSESVEEKDLAILEEIHKLDDTDVNELMGWIIPEDSHFWSDSDFRNSFYKAKSNWRKARSTMLKRPEDKKAKARHDAAFADLQHLMKHGHMESVEENFLSTLHQKLNSIDPALLSTFPPKAPAKEPPKEAEPDNRLRPNYKYRLHYKTTYTDGPLKGRTLDSSLGFHTHQDAAVGAGTIRNFPKPGADHFHHSFRVERELPA